MRTNYRIAEIKVSFTPRCRENLVEIRNSAIAQNVALQFWDFDLINIIEQFAVVFTDVRCRPIGFKVIAQGDIHSVPVDLKLVLAIAIKSRASGVLLVHNHPSGNVLPSKGDIELTKKFIEAFKVFNIKVLDHLIIGETDCYSMLDNLDLFDK